MTKQILSGNEAIARGLYEAGCHVAAAYPGTPSTEILENIGAHYSNDVYCQWACNEKVAFEIALGASIGGARAFAAMKHVGMNVAADPIFTMGYTGVRGGLVFVSADDPGCHSSQNEQDNRLYAPHAKIAMLEPSDSAECLDFSKASFAISEQFDTVVMIRMTTRVCHSKSIVELGERTEHPVIPYERNVVKFAMLPVNARVRHVVREKELLELERYSNDCRFNRWERGTDDEIGVITSGISYQYAKEVFGESASYLKLGLTYPLPRRLISEFAATVKTLYVIEENDPYLENAVRALGLTHCIGKDKLPITGELNAVIIKEALGFADGAVPYQVDEPVPARPPALCPGCPHRGFFHALTSLKNRIVPAGDIGCYALAAGRPLSGLDTCICMGSGISSLIGLAKALELNGDERKAIGCVGDSTFFHSGMTSLVDLIHAGSNAIACILDNSTTAMTGHQEHPGTEKNLMGQHVPPVSIEALVKAMGLPEDRLRIVDPNDGEAVRAAMEAGLSLTGPFVIIAKRPCALIKEVARLTANTYCRVDADKCRGCKLCMQLICPAMLFEDGKARIFDPVSCTGCGLCMEQCKFGAIEKVGD